LLSRTFALLGNATRSKEYKESKEYEEYKEKRQEDFACDS
jgi:hypothetical protein